MRCTCFKRDKVAALIVVGLLAISAPAPSQAQTVRCKVDAPVYALESDPIKITVPLVCGEDGSELPTGTEMVIGMTIYSDPFTEENLELIDQMPDNPQNAERIILGDEYADSYDFPLQPITLEETTQELRVVFQAPHDALADHRYLLTVIWPIESKEACDQTSEFQRQGCRDYGYLVGWDVYGHLLAYPGLVDMTDPDRFQVDTVRWVVERFR